MNYVIKYYNYEDLGITSAKKPFNTHLFWHHATYGFVMVDSVDQTVLLFSTKARLLIDGSDWDTVDLSDNTNSYKIQAGWLDGNDLWLVMCDNPGDDFGVCYVELDDSNDCNPVGIGAGGTADAGTVYAYDIFKIGTDVFVLNNEERTNVPKIVVWDVDTAPFIEKDSWNGADCTYNLGPYSFVVIVGNIVYFTVDMIGCNYVGIMTYNHTTTTIIAPVEYTDAGYSHPSSRNQLSIAYDGSDILYFIVKKDADSKNYLYSYVISTNTLTKLGEYNICLQLNRSTASGVMEKAFHLTEPRVYQLHPYAKYQLYYVANLGSGNVIIAITDNFLMLNGGEMYEYTDHANKMVKVEFVHEIQEASYGSLGVVRNEITIEKGMFTQIIGTFTTNELDRLYKGTYNFRDDAVGSEPSGWTSNNDADCTTTIIASKSGHKKVLQLSDQSGVGKTEITQTFVDGAQVSDTIEFYWETSDISKNSIIFIKKGASVGVALYINNSKFRYYDGAFQDSGAVPTNNVISRHKVVFDCATDTFDWYINGVKEVDGGGFWNVQDDLDRITFRTVDIDTGYTTLFDAISYSWDVNYNVGDNLSVEAGETDQVIFEGIVVDFDGERLQKVWLESPAKKELERKPRGDFSGRSDEIMASLVSTYCKYITVGTLSSGTAMGTITFAGDKTLQTIFNELSLFEKWKWKLDPQGRLFFNDCTIDTLVDLSKTDKIWRVKTGEVREPYNYFYLKGAILSNGQLVKEIKEADDLASQQQFGYNPFEETFASFNAQGILNQLATNIKAKLKETPLMVEFWHYDADLGMLAIMETITFVYDTTNVNVASDQFLINRVLFKDGKYGGYTIADELV